MQALSLYMFAGLQQTITLTQQKFVSFQTKFSAESYEMSNFF